MPPSEFIHRYIPPQNEDTAILLLLHGTGGNEDDLLGLGEALLPGAARLSPRGRVLENGMPRYFRRLSEGVFDLEDVRRRSAELVRFVSDASAHYQFNPQRVVAVGYSNGANIAASLLLLHPGVLAAAVLFHSMVPILPDDPPALTGVPVFMGSGRNDPIIRPEQSEELEQLLVKYGAAVTHHWESGGHGLSRLEIQAAAEWLRDRRSEWT